MGATPKHQTGFGQFMSFASGYTSAAFGMVGIKGGKADPMGQTVMDIFDPGSWLGREVGGMTSPTDQAAAEQAKVDALDAERAKALAATPDYTDNVLKQTKARSAADLTSKNGRRSTFLSKAWEG